MAELRSSVLLTWNHLYFRARTRLGRGVDRPEIVHVFNERFLKGLCNVKVFVLTIESLEA